jgi:putative FmdB family regulatory protein
MEALQSVRDLPLTECPHCGASALKKKTSLAAFSFKGSGWYKDLYASKGADAPKTNEPAAKEPAAPAPAAEAPVEKKAVAAAAPAEKSA